MAVYFVVVQREVLHTGRDTVALYTLYVRHYHLRCQIWVFAHVLEITSVERCTVDIDAGAEQHAFVAVTGFLANAFAVKQSHVGVPGSRQSGQRGKGGTGVVSPFGLLPFVPQHFGAHPHRAVGTPDFGDTQTRHTRGAELALGMDKVDFLTQGHTAESVLHAVFKWF